MEELKLNKRFETREECDKYVEELCEKYIVLMINMLPSEIDKEVYGVESILHYGVR